MLPRIASALVLAAVVLALVIFARPTHLLVFLGLVGSLCLREYFRLMDRMSLRGQPWFGYAGFWLFLTGLHWKYLAGEVLLAGILVSGFLAAMWRPDPVRDRVSGLMVNLLGVSYFGLFLYPVLPLRYEFGEKLGMHWILIMLVVIWAGDVAALFAGKTLGRTLFSPAISPKKTNEGAVAGLVAGVAAAATLQHFVFTELPLRHVAIASLLIGMVGQLGDLAESMLKRAADVKDSSNLIPGHGGVLDRIDSLLFAIPVLYLYLLRLYSS